MALSAVIITPIRLHMRLPTGANGFADGMSAVVVDCVTMCVCVYVCIYEYGYVFKRVLMYMHGNKFICTELCTFCVRACICVS